MRQSVICGSVGAFIAALTLMPAAYAQNPAPGLQDLVNARGSSGEEVLKERGYTFIRSEASGDGRYMYWREARTQHCIIVHVAEGRYQSLVEAPKADCKGGSADATPKAASGHGGSLETVCGVMVDGKPYRYKCRVNGAAPGGVIV